MKRNKKGFTLIEIIVVFAILATIFTIASFSIFQYLNKGQDVAYRIAENTLEDAASAAFTDCLTGTTNEFCSKYSLPKDKYDYQLVYLDELINNEYVDPIKNPDDDSEYCDLEKSYVYITNRADMSTSKNYDLQYKVCLICGDKESDYCRENLETEGDFSSLCYIYYDEAATIPYDGKWTDQNLYLKFTSEGNYKLGISHYEYQPKGDSRWTSVDTPQNIDTITVQLKNTVANKTYQVRGYDDFKRVGTIGECLAYDSATGVGKAVTIKIDKETVVSASITAKKETSKTTVNSGTWSNENIVLTAVGNPTSVVSGYTYQWYKDGFAISGATSKTYIATETGVYKVKVTNGVGNQSVISPEYNAKVDKVKPVITEIDNPTNENWTDQSFALTITVTETQSMIDYYQYKYEDTEWKKYENSTTSPFTTTDFTLERNEYVYIQVVDIAGNKSEIAKTMIMIDKKDISSVTVAGKTSNGTSVTSGNWKAENIILTGTVNPSTVISEYTYQWYKDGVAISGATSLTYTATTTGSYTLKVSSGVGKTKTSSAFDVKIDKTVLNTTSPTITASDGVTSGNWHTGNFTLTPSGVSSTSGITYYYGTSSNDVSTKYTSPISFSTNTTGQTYYFKACNAAGTCTSVSSYTIKLDKSTMSTKPTITASDGKTSGAWHTANFTLTPSGVSSTSGVTYYYGTTSGSLTTKYTSAVSISTNTASQTYYFKACNGAGVCSEESSYTVKLDKSTMSTTPTITASDGKASGAWHTANFTLTPSGASSTSGVTYYYGTSSTNVSTKYTSAISVSTNTASTIYYFKVCNGAGVCSGNSSYTAKLDKATPATPTITATDGITSGNWHTANVTLNFSGVSSTSGITYYYGTSSSSMTSTGSSVSYSTNTTGVTYYVKACNGAGTCSGTASYQIKLDKATPATPTITAGDGITSGYWHTANVTLNFSGASSTSGITYYYGTSSSSMTSTGSSVSYSTNTTGVTYYVKACNGAGTCGSTASYQIKLDKSTPSTPTITASDSITTGNWHTANFTLTFSGATSTSGITYYRGTSSSSMTTTGSSVSVSTATSTTTYYVKACNGAGTCSSNASYLVKLDKTKPTVSYSVAGGTYNTTKSVTITASDTNFSSMSVETYKDGVLQSGKSVSGRTSNTYTVSLDSAGSWTIYTKVYDAAGQIQSTTPQNSNSFYYQSYTINLELVLFSGTLKLYDGYIYGYEENCWEDEDGDWHGCEMPSWGPSSDSQWGTTFTVDTNAYSIIEVTFIQNQQWTSEGTGSTMAPGDEFNLNIGSAVVHLSTRYRGTPDNPSGEYLDCGGYNAASDGESHILNTPTTASISLTSIGVKNSGNQTLKFTMDSSSFRPTCDMTVTKIVLKN